MGDDYRQTFNVYYRQRVLVLRFLYCCLSYISMPKVRTLNLRYKNHLSVDFERLSINIERLSVDVTALMALYKLVYGG